MREIISKKEMWQYGRPRKLYPIWRWPLVHPSYYVSRFLINHGFKHPTVLSISMIIIGVCGAILLFFGSYYIRITGCLLIIFSYFFDLMDGKTARMLKKDLHIGKFLDRNYHVPVTTIAIFGIGFYLFKKGSNTLFGIDFSHYGLNLPVIYLLLGFFCSWLFAMKYMMYSSYIHFLRDIKVEKDEAIEPFLPVDMNKHPTQFIDDFTKNKIIRVIYLYFLRLFVDATDLWFLILAVTILGFEPYLLIALIFIYVPLFFINFYKRYHKLIVAEAG